MKVGVVSDIHTNIGGLKKAIELMGPVDRLICLGDCINEYRFSNEVIGLIREKAELVIQGNHEETFLSAQGVRARSNPSIEPSHLKWIAEQPLMHQVTWAGKKLMLVHATPWKPGRDYIMPGDPRLQKFGEVDADFVFYGHTHTQLAQRIGRVMVVNPGSAGEVRSQSTGSMLSCAVVDLITGEVRFMNYPDERI